MALYARLENLLEVFNQKLFKGRSENPNLNPRSCLSSVNSSCSCKLRVVSTSASEL